MPTTIRLNVPESAQSRTQRELSREMFYRGNMFAPISDRLWGDGVAQLKEISSAEARVILSDLRTQLRGRHGTKSGYLKLMHTSKVGRDQMVIERKNRLQTWFSREGKMARSGHAILDLLRKSGAASPQQLQDLETYLGRRGMAGTRAVAELLNRIDLDADPYEAIGSEACQKRGEAISNAWQAAGLAHTDDLQNFIHQSAATPPSGKFEFAVAELLMKTQPTPTAVQAGRVIRALLDSDDRHNPAYGAAMIATIVVKYHKHLERSRQRHEAGVPEGRAEEPGVESLAPAQASELFADLLIEVSRGHEDWLPSLLRMCAYMKSVDDMPMTVARLRRSIESRNPAVSNASTVLQSLDSAHQVDLTLNARELPNNGNRDEQTHALAAQAQTQRGYVTVGIDLPDEDIDAAGQDEAADRAAAQVRDFLAQSFAQGMTVSGNFTAVDMTSTPPPTQYRLVNSAITLTGDSRALDGNVPRIGADLDLRRSSIQQSIIKLVPQPGLRVDLNQTRLDGSTLNIAIDQDSSLSLTGLETVSLDGTSILLSLSTLRQQLHQQSPRQQTETLMDLFIGRQGMAPRVDIAHMIKQLPARYASLKVSLFLQVLEEAFESRPDLALRFAANALRVEPRLLTNPAVKTSVEAVLNRVADRVWAERETPVQAFERYVRLCDEAPVLKQLLDTHPGFTRYQSLQKAQTDPRGCRDNLEPVFRALTSLNEAQRQRWMKTNLGAAHILLHRAAGAGNPDWDANGELRRTLLNTLVSVPVVARGLDFYLQDIDYVPLSQDPTVRQQQRVDKYDQDGLIPVGQSGTHFALLSADVMAAFVQGQPIDGFFARQDQMLTIDQGDVAEGPITAAHQRAFDRFRDAKLDPILAQAVGLKGAHILSQRPDERFPADVHARLADRHAQGQNHQTLNTAELDALGEYMVEIRAAGLEATIESCPEWGGAVLSPQHLQDLRAHMLAAGIPDGDANFSGYLMVLASVYARLSSAAGFGTEDESIQALRGYSHALLNHAKLVGDQFSGADRRIPEAPLVDEIARQLRSNQCANILSADVMLPLARLHAPDIFEWLAPSGWRHLGARETNVLRALRTGLAANAVAPDPAPVQ
jgi:hypothetical protein